MIPVLLLLISNAFAGSITEFRTNLFKDYNPNTRPVLDFSESVELNYGIEIKSLEYFDQKGENIKFNLWIYNSWTDHYLKWNTSNNRPFITVTSDEVWTPDLELYNAASRPILFDKSGQMKLYSTGEILWIRPITYSFSCKLDLDDFPFDIQVCQMTFGSWKFSKSSLNLAPFNERNKYKNISISPDFYNNEWEIMGTDVTHKDYEYLCCPGELWPNTTFSITLKREYYKYLVVMAMCFVLILTGLTVSILEVTNYRRFYILVFIPLTIIWLQLYVSAKIPVVENSTRMEKYLTLSYVTTIILAVESGILYNYQSKMNKKYMNQFDFFYRIILFVCFISISITYFL